MGSLSKKSSSVPSSGAGGFVQMFLSGRRDGDSGRQRQDQWWLISWQENMVVSLNDWRSEMADAANHQEHLLPLRFAVTDGGGTLEIRCPYISLVVFDLHCLPHLLCLSKGPAHIPSQRGLSWPSTWSCSLFYKGYRPHPVYFTPQFYHFQNMRYHNYFICNYHSVSMGWGLHCLWKMSCYLHRFYDCPPAPGCYNSVLILSTLSVLSECTPHPQEWWQENHLFMYSANVFLSLVGWMPVRPMYKESWLYLFLLWHSFLEGKGGVSYVPGTGNSAGLIVGAQGTCRVRQRNPRFVHFQPQNGLSYTYCL